MKERKAFQHLPGEENPHFLENGKAIYFMLKAKYPKKSTEDLDSILNSLCAALTCLMTDNVGKDDHKNFIQLVYKILNDQVNETYT